MTKLLINEPPLQVLPTLARWIGLNEAIILQQVHYWLTNPKIGKTYKDKKWVRNTIDEWQQDNFPFWGMNTIRRAVKNLEDDRLLLSTSALNKARYDKSKWYTIDYETLSKLSQPVERVAQKWNGRGQLDNNPLPNLGNPSTQVGQSDLPNLGRPIPETTIETTAEILTQPPENICLPSAQLDPLSHIQQAALKGTSESTAPNPADQWWEYRDEFLASFQEKMGRYPNPVEKDDIVRLSQEFTPAQWKAALVDCQRHWTGKGDCPMDRIEAVLRAGGWQQWKEQTYGNKQRNGRPQPADGPATPSPEFLRGQAEIKRRLAERAKRP